MDWQCLFEEENQKKYFKQILSFLEYERVGGSKTIFPDKEDIFNVFKYTEF